MRTAAYVLLAASAAAFAPCHPGRPSTALHGRRREVSKELRNLAVSGPPKPGDMPDAKDIAAAAATDSDVIEFDGPLPGSEGVGEDPAWDSADKMLSKLAANQRESRVIDIRTMEPLQLPQEDSAKMAACFPVADAETRAEHRLPAGIGWADAAARVEAAVADPLSDDAQPFVAANSDLLGDKARLVLTSLMLRAQSDGDVETAQRWRAVAKGLVGAELIHWAPYVVASALPLLRLLLRPPRCHHSHSCCSHTSLPSQVPPSPARRRDAPPAQRGEHRQGTFRGGGGLPSTTSPCPAPPRPAPLTPPH
jgi:hypothetical protein